MDKIKLKRKNRFINISEEEETKLKKYKRNFFNIRNDYALLKIKQITNSSFNRKIVLPIIILFIFFISTSSLRKRHKQNYLEKMNIIYNNKVYVKKYRIPRKEALKRGRIYLDKCLEGLLFTHNKEFIISKEPKITVIIPVYNDEKMIKPVVRSAQNQNMTDIEIILINDYSSDNSLNIMEEMKKEDPRIKIINNEKNMGILYSRSIAVLEAKGKYIITLNPDDLFFNDEIFDIIYNEAEKGNFDIISFIPVYINYYKSTIKEMSFVGLSNISDSLLVKQPELSYFLFFKNNSFKLENAQIWGKLIRSEIYKNAVDLLGQKRYSKYSIINEDYISMYAICSVANSYKYLNKFGLFHYLNNFQDSNEEHRIGMYILFTDVIYDLTKKENKNLVAIWVLYLYDNITYLGINDRNNFQQILYKIMYCNDIESQYKKTLKEKLKGFDLQI